MQTALENVEDKIARWSFAAGIPPSAFDHPLWGSAFGAIRTAPGSMVAPRRKKLVGPILDRLYIADHDTVILMLNDPAIEHFDFSASTDKATVQLFTGKDISYQHHATNEK